jgi:hypothetical protein
VSIQAGYDPACMPMVVDESMRWTVLASKPSANSTFRALLLRVDGFCGAVFSHGHSLASECIGNSCWRIFAHRVNNMFLHPRLLRTVLIMKLI